MTLLKNLISLHSLALQRTAKFDNPLVSFVGFFVAKLFRNKLKIDHRRSSQNKNYLDFWKDSTWKKIAKERLWPTMNW